MADKLYSLRKSKQVLYASYHAYKKKEKKLPSVLKEHLKGNFLDLEAAINQKDRKEADRLAKQLEVIAKLHLKKTIFDYTVELVFALILALAVATVVRQMWFELYEIPTGSMRPTFREQDHVTVSKLTFGINFPLATKHLYFDPNLVQRTSVCIFSGDKIPFIDSDTTYFGIIPYKKRYIKRCMGKPGDTLYFYGGKIYGIDAQGNPLRDYLDAPWMKNLEYIPFLNFEGRVTPYGSNQILFHQMNIPIGKLILSSGGNLVGEVFDGKDWVREEPTLIQNRDQIHLYSDVWGIGNFAMARLLTKQQLLEISPVDKESLEEGVLYLELRHTPTLTYPKPLFKQEGRGISIHLNPFVTIIPLQQRHLDALLEHMYTARFVVKDGLASRYSVEGSHLGSNHPRFPLLADGSYEFYYGLAEKIVWGGIPMKVSHKSALYSQSPENVQKLFNLGIEMDNAFSPSSGRQHLFPQRYAYFRDGDLYLLGAPIIKKGDPTLVAFNQKEKSREDEASRNRPYIAFKDHGAPLKSDGSFDKEFIRIFGLHIPERRYLALGDNHAMSSDSRVFGFVPQDNLQGAPCLIIWPPGDRLGPPAQKPYPIFTIPRLIVWSVVALIVGVWFLIHRRHRRQPLVF